MPDNFQSSIIKIETLEKEYMLILKQYEENYNSYIDNLKNSKNTDFVTLSGRAYWGTGNLNMSTNKTLKQCETMCASDLKCTGATFNSSNNYCQTRIGESDISIGNKTDYAILPKIRQNLIILKKLNQKLLDINNSIKTELNKIVPIAQNDYKLKNEKQIELNNYYQKLLSEQQTLETTLNEYESIDDQYENNFINTVSQNTSLYLWTIISLIVVIITIKLIIGNTNANISFIFWSIIFILFFLLSLSLHTIQGFAVLSVLLIIILLIKMKILSP